MRVFLIILDSVGTGAAPDAIDYGDEGSHTLAHTAAAAGGLHLPTMQAWGLGCIPSILPDTSPVIGVPPVPRPTALWGAMQEVSHGKDTTTGHWEIAGIELREGFTIFAPAHPSFPAHLLETLTSRTGRPIIGNCAASGTKIIEDLGLQHMQTGALIVYTSADSVFQIAAHESVVPLPELYRVCEVARELCNPLRVGRIIARPFTGTPGAFRRTENRRDYSFPLPEPTVMDRLVDAGVPVLAVGKIDDIFAQRGFTQRVHVENNADAEAATLTAARELDRGFVFVNLIDFDMLYGHRRNPVGYARALEQADRFLGELSGLLRPTDLLIVTADHGNDPTFRGTDHTREYVPLLGVRPGQPGSGIGIRRGFFDVAQTVAGCFGLTPMPRGDSFLPSPDLARAV